MELILLPVAAGVGGVGVLLMFPGISGRVRYWAASPGSSRGRTSREEREIVESVAVWTEMLRDTLGASNGLEQALLASAERAPTVLEEHLRRLVAHLRYGSLEDAMREFAEGVDHPVCDFVVAALVTADRGSVRDLGALLGRLSESTRDECSVHMRVWVSRARSRTSVRIITGSVASFVLGLLVLNPTYLAPYASGEGLVVLIVVGSLFGAAHVALLRIARMSRPARFVSVRSS